MPTSIAFDVVETARFIRREFNRRAVELGTTRAQYGVLVRLHRSGGGLRQVELAEALDVEPITLCRMIDRLEEAGLVERRRDKSDRRAWLIYLTEAATPLVEELNAVGAAFDAEIAHGMSPDDQAALNALLGRVRANLTRMARERETDMDEKAS